MRLFASPVSLGRVCDLLLWHLKIPGLKVGEDLLLDADRFSGLLRRLDLLGRLGSLEVLHVLVSTSAADACQESVHLGILRAPERAALIGIQIVSPSVPVH